MKCRHCGNQVENSFVNLGSSPPSNSYLTKITINEPEKWYPLKVMVCDSCWLVQTEDFVGVNEMFSDEYSYFSSFSSSWLKHAETYVESMIEICQLNSESNVVEVAANDGYLLQYVKGKAIPCYGIEPTRDTAKAARKKGITIIEEFFGVALAEQLRSEGRRADLTVANNVLAHVPDINDFVKGFSILLKPNGVATFEFPHLLNLIELKQFDTIYHEHYSYLSLIAVRAIFDKNGLSVFDVEELPTHGGSLRIFAQRLDRGKRHLSENVDMLIKREKQAGINQRVFYSDFQDKVEMIKFELLSFLLEAKKNNKKVVAYGAAAKGNTFMNFAGIRADLLSYVVDKNPAKQDKFMPGSRIPIVEEGWLKQDKPDFIVIFPWNLKDEIKQQLNYVRDWGGQFVIAIPEMTIE